MTKGETIGVISCHALPSQQTEFAMIFIFQSASRSWVPASLSFSIRIICPSPNLPFLIVRSSSSLFTRSYSLQIWLISRGKGQIYGSSIPKTAIHHLYLFIQYPLISHLSQQHLHPSSCPFFHESAPPFDTRESERNVDDNMI